MKCSLVMSNIILPHAVVIAVKGAHLGYIVESATLKNRRYYSKNICSALIVLVANVNGFSSSPKLYKCLKSFKMGYRFDCNGGSIHERICCKFFKSKKKSHRRARVLQKVPDLNFRQDFDDDYNTAVEPISNDIEHSTGDARQFSGAQRRGIVLNDTESSQKPKGVIF